MLAARTWEFNWNNAEVPWLNPPSQSCPNIIGLRVAVERGYWWLWNYHGLIGVLTPAVLANALEVYDNARKKHRREPMPLHAGKFLWRQTISVEDAQKLLKAESGGEGSPD